MERDQARIEALHHVGRMRPDLSPTGQIAMAAQYERYLMGELDGMSLELAVAAQPAEFRNELGEIRQVPRDPSMPLIVDAPVKMEPVYGELARPRLTTMLGVSDAPMAEDYEYADGPVMPEGKAEVG